MTNRIVIKFPVPDHLNRLKFRLGPHVNMMLQFIPSKEMIYLVGIFHAVLIVI